MSPPPVLEIGREEGVPRLSLYGEPYAHYALEECAQLGAWCCTTITNLHSEESIAAPGIGDLRRFYRIALPMQ